MTDWVPEIRFSSAWKTGISLKMGLRQVEQGFTSFFAIFFCIFDDFSKLCSTFQHTPHLKIIKYAKNIAKNEENPGKPMFNLLQTRFSTALSKTQNSGFGYPIHHYIFITWLNRFLSLWVTARCNPINCLVICSSKTDDLLLEKNQYEMSNLFLVMLVHFI